MQVSADWALADQTRTFCLLVLDMENDYLPCAARTDARTFARLTRFTLCGASHTAAQRRCQLPLPPPAPQVYDFYDAERRGGARRLPQGAAAGRVDQLVPAGG